MKKLLIIFTFFLSSINISSETYDLTFACQITDQSIIVPIEDGTSEKYTNWDRRSVGDLLYFRLYEKGELPILKGGKLPLEMRFWKWTGKTSMTSLVFIPPGQLYGWNSVMNEIINLSKVDDSTYRLKYSSHHSFDLSALNLMESLHAVCRNFPVSAFEKIVDKHKDKEIFKD